MLSSFRISTAAIVRRSGFRWNSTSAFTDVVTSIRADLKNNIRQKGDPLEKNVIRSLLSEIKNLEIKNHNKKDNDKFDLYELFSRQISQRQDTAKEYLAKLDESDRYKELGETELKESEFILKYLKGLDMLTDEELTNKIEQIISELELKGTPISLQNIYKSIPMRTVENDWNCSKFQLKSIVGRLVLQK